MSVLGYMKPAWAIAEPWFTTWYRASSSSGWDMSNILTRPSVLEERRRVGSVGCREREVIVSVWDSIRESVGIEGLRWSL